VEDAESLLGKPRGREPDVYQKKMLLLLTACALWLTSNPASAVTIDWVTVGNPGNACDVPVSGACIGAVADTYRIGRHQVTNAQYAEFLNAKAASDTLGLYSSNMGSGVGGITRSGSFGSYTYSPIVGRENMPVTYVSFWDSARFANWLHNGQGSGDTETGAYTLLGGTAAPSNGLGVTRNAGATIFLPIMDEWYKAATYDASTASFFDYATGSDTPPTCASPGAAPNTANCANVVGDFTAVGSYTGSASPYGTFDQGGNAFEWNENPTGGGNRRYFMGSFYGASSPTGMTASNLGNAVPTSESDIVGFRVASLPEPGTGLLLLTGLLALAGSRRRCV